MKTVDHDVPCPICGNPAESGCVYGPDGWAGLRWRAGAPSIWGNLVTSTFGGIDIGNNDVFFRGAYACGIRCDSCGRIVVECRTGGGEDGPGLELVTQASDLERDGQWDQALALYQRVLDDPRYSAHHAYAQNGVHAIEEQRRTSKNA